jgi:quercetin dioxygenase-like cupin family protein
MTLQVRRIVTGHGDFGQGIVVTDEVLTAVPRGIGDGIEGCEIWSTNAMPIDNSTKADAVQRAGFVKKYNYVGSGEGTTIRIVEWTPGHAMFPHRTETLDYSILLSGEIDVEFDSGEVVHMKAGDVIVMRGITHCWRNTGSVPAVTAFILLDAEPPEVSGKRLHTLFPA